MPRLEVYTAGSNAHTLERVAPAFSKVLEIPPGLPLEVGNVRGRPDVEVGQLKLFTNSDQVAPGPQDVEEKVLERRVVFVRRFRQLKVERLGLPPNRHTAAHFGVAQEDRSPCATVTVAP